MGWTVTTSIISVRGWHGSRDKHHQHLFAPYKSQCLTDSACMTALPTQDKVWPAPASPVSHHWNWGCLVVSILYIYLRLQMAFWSESPNHPHLLCFSLVLVQKKWMLFRHKYTKRWTPRRQPTHPKWSLWNKHQGKERTVGPDSSDHGWAAGDHVPQETLSKCYGQYNITVILMLCKSNIIC